MNRAQLVELLTVERFMPLPPRPVEMTAADEVYVPLIVADTKEAQEARRQELLDATDAPAVLVQRRGIYVVPRSAA